MALGERNQDGFGLARIPKPVRGLLRWGAYRYLDLRDLRRSKARRIVFILSHMRSGSTLLMHLLASHPEILGAGERNLRYETAADLRKLEVVAFTLGRQFVRDYDYVVDQINHSRFVPRPELLDEPRLLKIFLVREPAPTIASIVEVLGAIYGTTLNEAVDYYLERLPALAECARRVADRSSCLLLAYEDLVSSPTAVLGRIESFLGLQSPLEQTYRTFAFTGKRGDPSRWIHSGRVRTDLPPRGVDLDPSTVDLLSEAYVRSLAKLREHCLTLD